ncbi:Lrp/AsnC family transcriptional regulator [Microvirga rosea]|uniref:Lrp/AsnC family transcriptional regulator n=1 Tax=Microvirga rosea TaxID=2715425 RepID=UPI001D0A56C5|nr:Lrp/AsnC family transcriptional regulator [Microvirga rosea]MCB8820131.1 Lrp/AsnC family transcriptional regulator [Microvirga rosea]
MDRNTNGIRRRSTASVGVDAVDRKLLGFLAEDATLSYAELGRRMNLSPPAVHERVKRLKETGVIRRTVAVLDPDLVGKPLLAIVHVDTQGWGKTPAMMRLAELPEVEEIHAVTGDTCLILKVRTAGPAALEDLLAHIYAVPGVRGTRSYIALRTHLERGTAAAIGLDGRDPVTVPMPAQESAASAGLTE